MSKLKESLILNVAFPLADGMMGTCAMKWLRNIREMNKWSREEIVEWQNWELQKFVKHAYEHTKYYHRLFDELGIKPNDIKTKEDLIKLPIVNKDVIISHFDEFVPDNIDEIRYRKARTGGTTGEPMYYYCDENTWGYVTAAKINAWKTTGYRYGDAFAALGSASLFPEKKNSIREIYDKMRNERGLNGMNMSDDVCKQYVEYIKKNKIRYIYGYAASIYLLAKYVIDHGVDLTQIECVFPTSEVLTEEYRKTIGDAFRCKFMDSYGAKDAGITAFEYNRREYRIGYNAIAETINLTDEGYGTLLTTNFLNYAFPMIRYEFGDEAIIGESENYNGQVIKKIIGRSSDVMRLENGRNVTGPGFTILMQPFDIVAYDIQKNGRLKVKLRIQKNLEKFTKEQEKSILHKFHNYIGEDCELVLEYVDHFEPLANGKRRYFMN